MGLLDGVLSLGANINKVKDAEQTLEQGVVSPLLPELKLDLSDEELIKLSKKWIARYEPYQKEISEKQQINEDYWLGKQYSDELTAQKRPLVDNLMFQALETFLPIATSKRPEPVVTSDNTPEGEKLASDTQKMLAYQADILKMKLKVKQAVRYWAMYYLGVAKMGFDITTNDITVKIIRPQTKMATFQ